MMRSWRGLVLLIIGAPGIAFPQDSIRFDAVEVIGERIEPSDPYRVTKMDSNVLRQHAFQDLGSLLEERSAMQVRRHGPSGAASLSFRGTRSNETRMYWNGLPLRSPTLGQNDLSLIPSFFLDRVELHHGGASAIDGTGGIGGSVHMKSGVKNRGPWHLRLQGRGASFGDRMGGADLSVEQGGLQSRTRFYYRSASNDFDYPDVTEKGMPEKKRKNAAIQRGGIMQDLNYGLGNGHRLFASAWYFRSSRDIPTPIDQVERGQHQEDRTVNSMFGWGWTGPSTRLSLRSGFFYNSLRYREEISDLNAVTRTRSWRTRLQGEHRFNEKRSISGAWAYDLEMARSSGYSGSKRRGRNRGYIQFENRFGERLFLQGLLQEEWVGGERAPLMPTMGLDLKIVRKPDLHFKANVSRSYRFPTLNDLYWEPGGKDSLSPQEGWSYESGLAASFGQGTEGFELKTEVTAFLLEMNDRIVWAPTSAGYWSPKNIDRSRDMGLEGSFDLRIAIGNDLVLQGQADHTYVNAEVIDQVAGEEPRKGQAIYVPSHRGSGTIGVAWKKKNRLRYGITYTGRRFIDRDNLRYLPAYTLQRIQLLRRLDLIKGIRMMVKAGVRNLFDIPYHSVAWQPMPGRSFELSIRIHFGP
ncbi:MAG: TonB-dependent receptor plug domain-containing protein [Flavobacteriales bacterium]